jgi:hypothetical protein
MARIVTAEYLAEEQKLKLDEPLDGVGDHEKLRVALTSVSRRAGHKRSGTELRGMLSAEAGKALAAAVDEAFGPINESTGG